MSIRKDHSSRTYDIIVCHEKHGDCYWDAQTIEAWAASSLAILTRRWNEGFWYRDPDDDGLGTSEWAEGRRMEYQAALAMSKEELQKLPETARKAVLDLRQQARNDSEWDREYRAWYELAKRVVKEQDLNMVKIGRGKFEHEVPYAWRLLELRSDHEHERVTFEPFQKPRDND